MRKWNFDRSFILWDSIMETEKTIHYV